MNRFFSKLDLRDIKIDPEGSRFPPDDDENEVASEPVAPEPSAEPETIVAEATPAYEEPEAPAAADDGLPPASLNGHGSSEALAAAYVAEPSDEVLKVSARSRPSAVAGAIAGVVREFGRAEVQAIGAGATNQAVKAVAIARDYLLETGIEAICLPAFIDVTIDDEDRTAIRLIVEPR